MAPESKFPKNMLPNEKVATLCRAYSNGTAMIPLNRFAVGHLNRAISWKYVHYKLSQIFDVGGFSIFRYKYAVAVEPPDDNPLGSTRRTQEEAFNSSGMLPTVVEREGYGLLTKNHLFLCLLVLLDGRIPRTKIVNLFGRCRRKMGRPLNARSFARRWN